MVENLTALMRIWCAWMPSLAPMQHADLLGLPHLCHPWFLACAPCPSSYCSLSLTHTSTETIGVCWRIIMSKIWASLFLVFDVYIVECDLNVHIGECNLNVMHETCSAACGSVGGEGPCRKVLVKNNRTDWLFLVVFTVPTLSVHIAFHFKLDNKEKSNHRFFK